MHYEAAVRFMFCADKPQKEILAIFDSIRLYDNARLPQNEPEKQTFPPRQPPTH